MDTLTGFLQKFFQTSFARDGLVMDLLLTLTEMNITDEVGSEPLLFLDFTVVPGFQWSYEHADDWQVFFAAFIILFAD